MKNYCEESVKTALNIIGNKWTVLILWHLMDEELRYNELLAKTNGISKKVLSQNLKLLNNNGLVSRRIESSIPPKVFYTSTEYASSLIPIFNELDNWGQQHVSLS